MVHSVLSSSWVDRPGQVNVSSSPLEKATVVGLVMGLKKFRWWTWTRSNMGQHYVGGGGNVVGLTWPTGHIADMDMGFLGDWAQSWNPVNVS